MHGTCKGGEVSRQHPCEKIMCHFHYSVEAGAAGGAAAAAASRLPLSKVLWAANVSFASLKPAKTCFSVSVPEQQVVISYTAQFKDYEI